MILGKADERHQVIVFRKVSDAHKVLTKYGSTASTSVSLSILNESFPIKPFGPA